MGVATEGIILAIHPQPFMDSGDGLPLGGEDIVRADKLEEARPMHDIEDLLLEAGKDDISATITQARHQVMHHFLPGGVKLVDAITHHQQPFGIRLDAAASRILSSK